MIGRLTLDQLRILVAVDEAGSFSGAARRLGRAQSAISQSIANLEAQQGVRLFDRDGYRPSLTDTGRVLVDHARQVLASAKRFEAVAAGTRQGLEAELTLAVDPFVPSDLLVTHLRALGAAFPDLPVSFSTEGLGGSLRRVRDGSAAIGIGLLLPFVPDDVAATALMRMTMVPVAAPSHPLSRLGRPATSADLEESVQLVLSDPVEPERADYGLSSARLWRFADLSRRMDFLQAGFGWCRMPDHMVAPLVAAGRLVALDIESDAAPTDGLTVYAAHRRDASPGPAGRWLLDAMRGR